MGDEWWKLSKEWWVIKKKIQTGPKVILKFFFFFKEEEEETLAHIHAHAHDEQNMQPISFKLYT